MSNENTIYILDKYLKFYSSSSKRKYLKYRTHQSALQLKFWQKESERMSCASLATSLVVAVNPT